MLSCAFSFVSLLARNTRNISDASICSEHTLTRVNITFIVCLSRLQLSRKISKMAPREVNELLKHSADGHAESTCYLESEPQIRNVRKHHVHDGSFCGREGCRRFLVSRRRSMSGCRSSVQECMKRLEKLTSPKNSRNLRSSVGCGKSFTAWCEMREDGCLTNRCDGLGTPAPNQRTQISRHS